MTVGIIIGTPRDICIGGVTTTGITSTDHTWERAIIVTGSITTGRKATKITIANIRAGSIKKSPLMNSKCFQGAFLFCISQYFQHALRRLLLGINPVNHFSIAVVVNNNMFR